MTVRDRIKEFWGGMNHKARRDEYRRTLLCEARELRRANRKLVRHFEPPIIWCLKRVNGLLEWMIRHIKEFRRIK